MKKVLAMLISLAILAAVFCSCSLLSDDQANVDSDDILSWTIQLDGTSLTLPCDYAKFKELGYNIDGADEDLEGHTYTIGVYLVNAEGDYLSVQFVNNGSVTQKLSECQVGMVKVEADDGIDLVLPGGLKFDETVTADMVKEQYGAPESESGDSDYVLLVYKPEGAIYSKVEFLLHSDEAMTAYNSVTVKNLD